MYPCILLIRQINTCLGSPAGLFTKQVKYKSSLRTNCSQRWSLMLEKCMKATTGANRHSFYWLHHLLQVELLQTISILVMVYFGSSQAQPIDCRLF